MTSHTKILRTLLVAGAVSAGTLAPQTPVTANEPAGRLIAEHLASLGLTAEQKSAVKTILRNHQPTVGPLLKQVVAARRARRDTLRAPAINEAAIRAQAATVGALEGELAVQRAHLSREIGAVLTPTQRQQLQELRVDLDARVDAFLQRIAKRIAAG